MTVKPCMLYLGGGLLLLILCLSFLGPFVIIPATLYIRWCEGIKVQDAMTRFIKRHRLPPFNEDEQEKGGTL